VYELRLPALLTSIRFARGHRIRAQISASFAPHMSRNLQTGESEIVSAAFRTARITIHHGGGGASKLLLPIAGRADESSIRSSVAPQELVDR
jgi:predicted acyl esterase